MPAPIAVFAFNRPEHLLRTPAALAANDPLSLCIRGLNKAARMARGRNLIRC